jgi:hypothetical protein
MPFPLLRIAGLPYKPTWCKAKKIGIYRSGLPLKLDYKRCGLFRRMKKSSFSPLGNIQGKKRKVLSFPPGSPSGKKAQLMETIDH